MLLKLFFRIKNTLFYYIKKMFILLYSLEFKNFGKNNTIWFPVRIYGKENVSIGNNCGINAFVHIWGNGGVDIGNNVMIAIHVSITSITHDYNSSSMRFSKITQKNIIIEDNVWIGSGAIIMPGIIIVNGAVIGAGTIVTKDVPPMAILVGNTGRIINWRDIKTT